MTPPYFVDVSVVQASIVVALNGIPLFRSPGNGGYSVTSDVSVWIKPDLNVLSVRLFDPVHEPAVQAEARLFLPDPAEEVVTLGTVLLEFVWPPVQEDPADPIPPLPYNASLSLQVTSPPPTRLWSEAVPRPELGDADRQAILALVETLRQRLMASDAAGALALMDYKVLDDARASGKTPERVRGAALELLEWMVTNPLTSRALEPAEAEWSVLAGGRVVRVGRLGGAPALQFEEPIEANRFSFEIYCAFVGGSWRIVR